MLTFVVILVPPPKKEILTKSLKQFKINTGEIARYKWMDVSNRTPNVYYTELMLLLFPHSMYYMIINK